MIPGGTSQDVADLLHAFAGSEVRARLAEASDVTREQRFAFPFEGTLVTGTFDVLATEAATDPDHARLLVVDYKSDRLEGAAPAYLADTEYRTQRLIYAIAALRRTAAIAAAGEWSVPVPRRVEVAHLFLEAPADPASVIYEPADLPALERELAGASAGLRAGVFEVASAPNRSLCHGCPARGGLCSWPAEVTYQSPGSSAGTPS